MTPGSMRSTTEDGLQSTSGVNPVGVTGCPKGKKAKKAKHKHGKK